MIFLASKYSFQWHFGVLFFSPHPRVYTRNVCICVIFFLPSPIDSGFISTGKRPASINIIFYGTARNKRVQSNYSVCQRARFKRAWNVNTWRRCRVWPAPCVYTRRDDVSDAPEHMSQFINTSQSLIPMRPATDPEFRRIDSVKE